MRRGNFVAIGIFFLLLGGLFFVGPSGTQRIQSSFLELIAPFLKTGSNLEKRITAIRQGLKTLDQLEIENRELAIANKELRATNLMLRELEEENQRLRKSLGYRERASFRLVPARIIARDASTWWNTMKIDRGFEDGLDVDMPVITEEGLVGKTITVARNASTVLLISDEMCRVAVNIEGSRDQGIVSGERSSQTGSPVIGLRFLPKMAGLQPGQKVYSSGVGGVYPPGLLVGSVKEFKVRELDSYATIDPAVDLTTLEDVFVVVGKK